MKPARGTAIVTLFLLLPSRGLPSPSDPILIAEATAPAAESAIAADDTVYISGNGTAYHRADCPRLHFGQAIKRHEVLSSHSPCAVCKPGNASPAATGTSEPASLTPPAAPPDRMASEPAPTPTAVAVPVPVAVATPPAEAKPADSKKKKHTTRWVLIGAGAVVGLAVAGLAVTGAMLGE